MKTACFSVSVRPPKSLYIQHRVWEISHSQISSPVFSIPHPIDITNSAFKTALSPIGTISKNFDLILSYCCHEFLE